ncbi:MAG: CDP-alcohol phosphatidyltransferase family protein [Pseudomonadota bacterium]
MAEIVFISEKNRERYLSIIKPFGNLLSKIGVHPHALTVTGLILSIVAAILYGNGSFFWAAWVVVLAGTCDTLDGQLARKNNKQSLFGAFFDSTLDRYSDIFLYMGLAYHFAGGKAIELLPESGTETHAAPWTVLFITLAITGSFMVSYTRARAEALGIQCGVGLMQRPERIVLLIIGSLLGAIPNIGPFIMKFTVLVLAVASNITAIHRILHVRNSIARGSRKE